MSFDAQSKTGKRFVASGCGRSNSSAVQHLQANIEVIRSFTGKFCDPYISIVPAKNIYT
jgi:hypothetical protein